MLVGVVNAECVGDCQPADDAIWGLWCEDCPIEFIDDGVWASKTDAEEYVEGWEVRDDCR